ALRDVPGLVGRARRRVWRQVGRAQLGHPSLQHGDPTRPADPLGDHRRRHPSIELALRGHLSSGADTRAAPARALPAPATWTTTFGGRPVASSAAGLLPFSVTGTIVLDACTARRRPGGRRG